jgi:hypothetical protein
MDRGVLITSVASGWRVSELLAGAERAGSRPRRHCADAREDFIEQVVSGQQAQGERSGVTVSVPETRPTPGDVLLSRRLAAVHPVAAPTPGEEVV